MDKDSPYYGVGYILRPVNRPKPYKDKNERAIAKERRLRTNLSDIADWANKLL